MAKQRGTLHVLCNFQDGLDRSGVYDVAFTLDDSNPEPVKADVVRRFYGEQELTEFLKKHLRCNQKQVSGLLQELQREGRARISGLEMDNAELRNLKLAA